MTKTETAEVYGHYYGYTYILTGHTSGCTGHALECVAQNAQDDGTDADLPWGQIPEAIATQWLSDGTVSCQCQS
jgi:hypothetical protein